MLWNSATRDEIRAVLTQIPQLSWERFCDCFLPENEFLDETRSDQYGLVHDAADREFAALAAATDATLVTSDHHLLDVRDGLDLRVRTPGEQA